MKLKFKFLLLMSAIFISFLLIMWHFSIRLIENVSMQWGEQFAERQVMFDKYRTLSPLIREIALARQMASEQAIIDMALHENNPEMRKRGIAAMEKYRFNFRDHSYFAAFSNSGHYYFNDAKNQYAGKQLRYILSPFNGNDKWFYATLQSDKEYQVNLDPDIRLSVTKAWINVVIKSGDKKIGIVGTGIDLSDLINETVNFKQTGIQNLFIDKSMAIQLNSDPMLIDYMTIAKEDGQRIKINTLLKNPNDVQRLQQVMNELENSPQKMTTLWVDYQNMPYLLGVAYLPEIGWYDLTLMDGHHLNLFNNMLYGPLLFAIALLIALLVMAWAIQRWILKPIKLLQQSADKIREGDFSVNPVILKHGEISDLSLSFDRMAKSVIQSNRELEEKVLERTNQLHHLTEIDPLTKLLNRRGMASRFEKEIARQSRGRHGLGLLLMDLDHFKNINDRYGHAAGDLALCEVSNVIQTSLRSYDHAARWGGEEFLILLPDCADVNLLTLAERIRQGVAALNIQSGAHSFNFTVSIGAHQPKTPQTVDAMLQKVDAALYQAKSDGRNCVRVSA